MIATPTPSHTMTSPSTPDNGLDAERFISGPDGWQCKDCGLYPDLCVCDDPDALIRQTVVWPTNPVWLTISAAIPSEAS